MVLLQLFVKKIKFCVIFRHFPRIYYRSVFMLLNILHREGKFKLNEKKNSSKHAGRYNPEEKSRELIRNVNKICELRGISHYTLAKKRTYQRQHFIHSCRERADHICIRYTDCAMPWTYRFQIC